MMRTKIYSLITLCAMMPLLSGCSGTSILEHIGFAPSTVTEDTSSIQSHSVKDFAATCVKNANDFNHIKKAAQSAQWQPVSRAFLLLNGFKTISQRRDILTRRGSKVAAYKKTNKDVTSILLFYKMKYNKESQIKCELYANGEPRERVYTALNSLIKETPLRNKKTDNSHLSVWRLRKKGKPFTVRYLYEFNQDDLLEFNGVMIWTHYS